MLPARAPPPPPARRPPARRASAAPAVLVVPGNPGAGEWYAPFCASLSTQLASLPEFASASGGPPTVAALSLLGHTRHPGDHDATGRTFTLDEQLAAVVAAADAAAAGDGCDGGSRPVFLVGHSIGAWLALRAMAARPGSVRAVVGLTPYLTNNVDSRTQRVLAAAARSVALRRAVCGAARVALGGAARLPPRRRASLLRSLLRASGAHGCDAAAAVTLDWLRPASVANSVALGCEELGRLGAVPDWGALLLLMPPPAGAPAAGGPPRASLLFGEPGDMWAPPAHAAAAAAVLGGGAVRTDPLLPHLFPVTEAGSARAARHAAAMLADLWPRVIEK